MRTYDMTPLLRNTVGFDRLFSMIEQVVGGGLEAAPTYPPYNIERTDENAYRITVAVAGFTEQDLTIEVKENTLTIRGDKQANSPDEKTEILYQGIAARSFERRFQLADGVLVQGASMRSGLLDVDLIREIPEAKKPRLIDIKNGGDAKTLIDEKSNTKSH